MAKNTELLADIFQMVTKSLTENQQALNRADEHNHDHGDNMVKTFQTISSSLQQKKSGPDSAALAFAAKQLSKKGMGGSSQLYAKGLTQAAKEFKGRQVDAGSATQLLQMLIGGGQAQPQPASTGGGDLLGSLLGGLAGGQGQQTSADSGLDLGDLLNAGMAYLQAKQGGGSNAEAIIQAVLAGSGMGSSPHRSQSTQLVVNTFMDALSSLAQRR
jgi:hypothetical protein